MLVLTRSDLERVLPFDVCIEEMRRAMIATSARDCVLPLRQFMPVPGRPGKLGLMPGYIGGESECFGVKIVSKYERAAGDPHGSHVGAVLLLDAATGLPLAFMEGGTLTAIRTASMTALATDVLARPDARRLAVLGTGEEAWYHVRALRQVRPFEDILIWGRSPERAQALVERLGAETDEARFADWANLLFEQAMLAEGGQLEDPGSFVRRLNGLMLALAGAAKEPSRIITP